MTHCGITDNLSELGMKTVDLLANVDAKEVFKYLHFIRYQVQQIVVPEHCKTFMHKKSKKTSIYPIYRQIKLIELSTYLPINYLVIYLSAYLPI